MISVILLAATMMDPSLNPSQRNDACFALRGEKAPEVISAMRKALRDSKVRACAGTNLRVAGAEVALRDALGDDVTEVRALAARELSDFSNPEIPALLAAAAQDSQLIVASNAVESLAVLDAVPELKKIAQSGGIVGTLALDRLTAKRSPAAAEIARLWIASPDVNSLLTAIRVLGELGDRSDTAALRKIADTHGETVSSRGRGFGLMPAISLAQAARVAMEKIESRSGS